MKTFKVGKASGADGVAPDLIKHFPLNTQKEILLILSANWTTGWCPQAWRTATIVPFLEKEKDAEAVSSNRPIAPTFTIGKLLERLIVNRPSWWLKAKSLLSPWQAGFRKRQKTTDQCLILSQFASDGIQSTNEERDVRTLIDYSMAYDTVWRTGLLQKMLDIGVPQLLVQWTTALLTTPHFSRPTQRGNWEMPHLKEGIQKSPVLLALLFVLYIKDLLGNLEKQPWLVHTLMISL